MLSGMIRRILLLLVVLPWLAGCAPERDEAARLHDLFAREWQTRLREDPLLATAVGVHDYDDRLPDMSPRDLQRRDELSKDILNELTGIDRSRLSDADRINLEIFGTQLRNRIAHHRFGLHEIPFTADSGFHTGFARLPFEVPLDTAADYDNYLSRLNQWPRYVDEQIALMRSGIERGMTQPRAVLDGIEDTMAAHVVDDAAQSVFWEPFDRFPRSVPVPEHDRLQQAGRRAILESIVPGYRKLHDFFVSEYVPGARQTLGAADLPNGPEYYRQRITEFTSLDLTPEEIHEIGLAEVERIHGEMLEIIDAVGFEDGFEAFLGFLRTDPRFYARTSEELLQRAAYITKTMDGKLPALFKTMPRLPYP